MSSSHWPAHLPLTFRLAETTLSDNLEQAAARLGDRPGIRYFGRDVGYREWAQSARRFAAWLQQRAGIQRGDRVVVFMQNCPQWLIAYSGILRADAVVVPVSPMYGADELRVILRDSGATAIACARDLAEIAVSAAAGTPVRAIVTTGYGDYLPAQPEFDLPEWITRADSPASGCTPWRDVAGFTGEPMAPRSTAADMALLPYTSGSTGVPKGCVHTHGTFMHTAQGGGYWYGLTTGTVCLALAPMYHVSGLTHSVNVPLMAGATLVVQPRWDSRLAAQLIERYRVRHAAIAPAAIIGLLANEEHLRHDLSSLACVMFGGTSMPSEVAEKLQRALDIRFIEGYGMTETAAAAILNPLHRPKRQSLGIPFFHTDVRIADPDTGELKDASEAGEILVHGPQLMKEYWGKPEDTRQAFRDIDGVRYLRTGDVGFRDDEGYYVMADRLKRMINASGFKVWPTEIENKLHEHPAIAEVCVIGKKDSYRGECPKALVVLKPGARASEEEIVAWSRDRMAAYKYPRSVEFLAELPKALNGKTEWRELQAREDALGSAPPSIPPTQQRT